MTRIKEQKECGIDEKRVKPTTQNVKGMEAHLRWKIERYRCPTIVAKGFDKKVKFYC